MGELQDEWTRHQVTFHVGITCRVGDYFCQPVSALEAVQWSSIIMQFLSALVQALLLNVVHRRDI